MASLTEEMTMDFNTAFTKFFGFIVAKIKTTNNGRLAVFNLSQNEKEAAEILIESGHLTRSYFCGNPAVSLGNYDGNVSIVFPEFEDATAFRRSMGFRRGKSRVIHDVGDGSGRVVFRATYENAEINK